MQTECNADLFGFARVEGRSVVAGFDGGKITSDAGGLLLRASDRAIGLIERFARCFTDSRSAELVEHTVATMIGQRVFGIALGCEDLVDHDELRHDPIMAVLAGKLTAKRKNCAPVAGKSTLNRLELGGEESTLYHKVGHDPLAIEAAFVDLFIDAQTRQPRQIILDLDATDDPLHGHRGRPLLPRLLRLLLLSAAVHILRPASAGGQLRRSNIDASAGAVEEVARVITRIRSRWPRARILLRADAGFAREALMRWCELNRVDYLFGLARNERLVAAIATELRQAQQLSQATARPARRFKDLMWSTLDSWSRQRRVVGKAEWTGGEANPRFIVTSLSRTEHKARHLYEKVYCARGEMENRIKECQLDLFADRTSAKTMRANQLRLWFASMAYVLMCALRRIALQKQPVCPGHLWHDPPQAVQKSVR